MGSARSYSYTASTAKDGWLAVFFGPLSADINIPQLYAVRFFRRLPAGHHTGHKHPPLCAVSDGVIPNRPLACARAVPPLSSFLIYNIIMVASKTGNCPKDRKVLVGPTQFYRTQKRNECHVLTVYTILFVMTRAPANKVHARTSRFSTSLACLAPRLLLLLGPVVGLLPEEMVLHALRGGAARPLGVHQTRAARELTHGAALA